MTNLVVIIPAYKARDNIVEVILGMPDIVSRIIVVDDACPEGTGALVNEEVTDPRVEILFNDTNLGVGGAVIRGFRRALDTNAEVILKIDADGQMDPQDIPKLIDPITSGRADYSKGNRFNSLDDLQEMPKLRVFGNAALSLLSKFSTGYWTINDPTNGFFAIHRSALENIHLGKLKRRWFFESDILFRLAIIRAVVEDVPIKAQYRNENSNLQIRKVVLEFLHRHNVNFLKRIFYVYYLREWSIASIELPSGLLLVIGGTAAGLNILSNSPSTLGQFESGEALILAILPIILGFQLLLSFLSLDVSNEPKTPVYARFSKAFEK